MANGKLYNVKRIADESWIPLTCDPKNIEIICKRDGYELPSSVKPTPVAKDDTK